MNHPHHTLLYDMMCWVNEVCRSFTRFNSSSVVCWRVFLISPKAECSAVLQSSSCLQAGVHRCGIPELSILLGILFMLSLGILIMLELISSFELP